MVMRLLVSIAMVLGFSSQASFAQEWREFVSQEDRFSCNFPAEPEVTDIVWETEYDASIPGRVYTVKQGPSTYSVTVVDYSPVEAILTERSQDCPPGLERCNGLTSFPGPGYWKNDVRGAMIYAAFRMMQRDITLTHYMWSFLGYEAIESNELQFINNADQSRTFANIYMHHNRLYIMEGTSPQNYPPPALFVQSIGLYEEDGTRANHERVYYNGPQVDPDETNEFRGRLQLPPLGAR